MKILNITILACLFCIGIESCSYAQKREETKTFRLPDVPDTLTAPEDRAAYLSLHYWDHFDFADTSLISRPEITEQAFVDFASEEQKVNNEAMNLVSILMNVLALSHHMLVISCRNALIYMSKSKHLLIGGR